MKRTTIAFNITILFLIFGRATFAADPYFSGFWTLDRTKSEGVPPNAGQTMTVRQTSDKITFETDLVKGERIWQTFFAAYTLDGEETLFESRTADGIVKGKRTAKRTAGGIELTETTSFDAPGGAVIAQTTRRLSLSADGKTLKIEMTVQNPGGTEQNKRVFKKGEKPPLRIYFVC